MDIRRIHYVNRFLADNSERYKFLHWCNKNVPRILYCLDEWIYEFKVNTMIPKEYHKAAGLPSVPVPPKVPKPPSRSRFPKINP